MKVEILKETLSQALNIQLKAVSAKTNIASLSNVLLRTDNSKLYLNTTNLELSISSWIGAEVTESGTTTVPIKRFLEYVNTLPEGPLSLSLEKNELVIKSKNNKASFNTIPAEDFPKIPEIKEDQLFSIDSTMFFAAINSVVFSASKDETKPTFTGLFLEVDKSSIDFVAIDGFRMTKRNLSIETGISEKTSFIIPSFYIEEIARLNGEKGEDIKIYSLGGKNQIGFRYKSIDFILRTIEGNYPNYSRIIPAESDFTTFISINRQELLDAVKISNIFSSQKEINKTNVRIESDHVVLTSFQKEVGENETRIDCSIKGDLGNISYNSRFLQEAISHFTADNIIIKIVINKDTPSTFYNSLENEFEADDSFFHLMTPLQTKSD